MKHDYEGGQNFWHKLAEDDSFIDTLEEMKQIPKLHELINKSICQKIYKKDNKFQTPSQIVICNKDLKMLLFCYSVKYKNNLNQKMEIEQPHIFPWIQGLMGKSKINQ